MSGLPKPAQDFVDGETIGVAVVGRDARGELVVNACNEPFLQMTGAALHDAPPVFPMAFDTLIPAHARAALRGSLRACFESEAAQTLTQTFGDAQGARSWRLSLQPMRHANNVTNAATNAATSAAASAAVSTTAPHEILITAFDTAPKAHLTHELEFSAKRFRAVVDSAYDAIVTIDEEHRIRLFNRAAENLFGYTSADVLGQRIEMLLPERFRANHSRNVRQFAESPLMSLRSVTAPRMDESNSVYGRHRDGTTIPVEIAISKISVDGVVEFTAVVRDITERAEFMEMLRRQAATDALTGLPNRREFIDFVDRALGTDQVLSVFILDIDFFKNINDSYGHDIGDEVLRVLAQVGMSIPRRSAAEPLLEAGREAGLESGLFARWGGEEFVAALPGADAAAAHRIADTLRQRFEAQDFEHAWRVKPIPFTVSIGVVTREPGERDVDALMRRADRALYQAKATGRNRVEAG